MEAGISPEIRYCAECGRPSAADEFARFGDTLICADCKNRYAQKLREGVAPAAAMSYGGFWIRLVAHIIDRVILAVAQSIAGFALFSSLLTAPRIDPSARPEEILGPMLGMIGLLSLVGLLIDGCYETFFVARLGATPGKMALGFKVVRANGGRVDLGRAVGRYFAKVLSGMILGIGYIMVGFDSQKRGLHDMICDTRVIKARD